jgi:glyoxylase I family protein
MVEDVCRPQQVGMSHLGFSVTDLDRSIKFYCDVLGAALARAPHDGDGPSFSGRMALVMVGANGLDLYEHAGNEGERFDRTRAAVDSVWRDAPGLRHEQHG